MAEVVWSKNANRNLDSIAEHIGRDSPHYAHVTVQKIHTTTGRLRSMPRSGRIVPEFQLEFIRELIVGNYRVVYLITEEVCNIIAVVHSRRDLVKTFVELED